jgi:hypothetical protein
LLPTTSATRFSAYAGAAKAAMQVAKLVTASNLENQPFMEFPTRTIGPGLGRAKPLHAIVGRPLPTVQWLRLIGMAGLDLTAK